MKLAGSFKAAVEVAEKNCSEWIFVGSGEVFHAQELYEIAKEYDEKTPLGDEDFLAVTDDGSIGLLFPNLKEPQWFFVSPGFAVVNILHEDLQKYIIPINNEEVRSVAENPQDVDVHVRAQTEKVFCKNCGEELEPGSCFCGNCGARNALEFCSVCGAQLQADSKFCANCGTKI